MSLLFDALRRRVNVETVELPVDKHPALFSEMQTNASISWALMTKHHLETLLETVKNDQVRRETELQSYWETRLTQRRCAGLHERYQKYGGMLRYQKIGYEKERTIHALERIWRRQVIQKALRKKLRQKLGGFANDRERAEAKIAEADRLGEQIQAYRDFVEVLKSLDGNRPLQIIAERLQEKRHRLHIRLYLDNKEIERIDQLEMKEAGPIGIKAPEEVEKLAFALVQNGFSGFEKGSDWVRTGKSNNPFLTFALITEYPLEMDQVLSRLPPEAFPPLPIPILSVREAETLVEAGEYRTIMRMKLRWVPSLTERALRLRLDPGSRASEENGLSRERDLSRWLQTNRAVHHAQIENLGAAIKKTEGQIERLALFAHTLGPDPEAAYERQAEHRLSLERDLRLLSKSIDGYLEKIEESEVLSRSLGEEERVLRLKAGSLDREEQEWSLLSSEIEQVCNIPLKDFSIFFLSIQKRLSELEAKAQETEGSMDESLSELRNPLLSLIAREPQTDPSVFDAHPALLWEILTEIRSLELELQSLFHERATLSARRQRGGNAEALPKPDSPPARGGEGDPKEEGVSEVVESAETLERRIREIEEKREEIKQSIAEGDRAQRVLESLVGRQERLLAEIGIREKKYIPGLARLFLKKDLYGLWEENETEYRKRLYAAERLRQQLDKEWAELKRMLDPSENWEEPILEASEDEGLEGGFSVIARLLSVLKRRINEEKSEERRTHAALSHFSKEIGSVMETLNAHLRDIAHFSRPGPEAAPLLEFSFPRHSPEEYAENFSKRLSEYIARQRAQQQDVRLQWPLRTLWEFYYDQRLEIRIDKPPFTRSGDGKYAWKDVEKWSTGEKMAVYLVLYACLFAWWKGHAASPQPSSILVLDHLFGHINTETLLEIPMRMLYTHNFQIIGFTSSAEPFLFKYFPKWIGLSPQETDHYNFFLPFHVER